MTTPLTFEFWCDLEAANGGDGSIAAPFNLLRDAIAAAPDREEGACTIHLAPVDVNSHPDGYFDGSPIAYTDKRLSIQGSQLLNESPDPPTFGMHLQPTSSNNSNMPLEIIRTNSNVTPKSQGIIVIMQDGHCEGYGDGSHWAHFELCGTTAFTNRLGTASTQQASMSGTNYGVVESVLIGAGISMLGGRVFGPLSLLNASGGSTFQDAYIEADIRGATGHVVNLWGCTFPSTTTLIITGTVFTDKATYARGVLSGVTWPGDTTIVDRDVPLQAGWANSGPWSNSNSAALSPTYGTNVAGDLFVCRINAVSGSALDMGAGWTKLAQSVSSSVMSQVWVRDARSAGGETGGPSISLSGNYVASAVIDTWRNVAETDFIEAISYDDGAGASPMTISAPTVTPDGFGRVAVLCSFSNGGAQTATEVSGETGGTWLQKGDQAFSGLGSLMDLQTALTPGGVSGGTFTMPGSLYNYIAFAIVGAAS